MATKTITLTLAPDDAEPILRKAAYQAALNSALVDHITSKTVSQPGNWRETDKNRKAWQESFLRAKRLVEAFGVEYSPTSEEETLTVYFREIGGKRTPVNVGGVRFTRVENSKPDYKHPFPEYRRGVHEEACRAAADRVVKAWRATL